MTCKECGLRNNLICLISQREIPDLTHAACPWGRRDNKIRACDFCGGKFEEVIIDVSPDNIIRFICSNCFNQLHTCSFCIHQSKCAFIEDQRSPDFIMKTFQQSGMVLQTQVKNPDKIQIHCIQCRCWDTQNNYCMKEQGFCELQEEKPLYNMR